MECAVDVRDEEWKCVGLQTGIEIGMPMCRNVRDSVEHGMEILESKQQIAGISRFGISDLN